MILGVSVDRLAPKAMQQFVNQHDVPYPIVLDRRFEVSRQYHVQGTPTSYLIDRNGTILAGAVGPQDWNSHAARKAMARLLQSP